MKTEIEQLKESLEKANRRIDALKEILSNVITSLYAEIGHDDAAELIELVEEI